MVKVKWNLESNEEPAAIGIFKIQTIRAAVEAFQTLRRIRQSNSVAKRSILCARKARPMIAHLKPQ
jgi:hypothetical protein